MLKWLAMTLHRLLKLTFD